MVKAKKPSPSQIIHDSLKRKDPTNLAKLVHRGLTYDQMLDLREQIGKEIIKPVHYDLLLKWMFHDNPAIARAVRIILLFISDTNLQIALFTRLAQPDVHDVPFAITYNHSEKEFGIELPKVPGYGVSHYGSDNPQIDRLLEVLERLYRKIHSGYIPPYFRS